MLTQEEAIERLDKLATDENHLVVSQIKAFLHGPVKRARPSQLICVVGSASGAGATTVASNLALELAELGRVALIDLDLEFGGIACAFDVEIGYTIADVCCPDKFNDLDETILDSALYEKHGISILGRPHSLIEAGNVDPNGIAKALDIMSEMFEYVIVDLSRINNELGLAALRKADKILIVIQPNVLCVRNVDRIVTGMIDIGVDPDNMGVVFNRFESKNDFGKSIEASLKRPIVARIPNSYSAVSMSLDTGVNAKDNSLVRVATRNLALCMSGAQPKEEAKPSWFRRFINKLKKGK